MQRKSRRFLFFLLAALLGWVAWTRLTGPKPDAPAPVSTRPKAPAPADVAIEDRKTIDFSSGRPVVKDDTENRTAIDGALPAMQAALKDVSFEPPKPAPAPEKKP